MLKFLKGSLATPGEIADAMSSAEDGATPHGSEILVGVPKEDELAMVLTYDADGIYRLELMWAADYYQPDRCDDPSCWCYGSDAVPPLTVPPPRDAYDVADPEHLGAIDYDA